jgi:hypothetical protein
MYIGSAALFRFPLTRNLLPNFHGDKSGYFVCVIPGEHEVDLKMAAKVSGNKKCDLIPMKELLPLTGYIRGGCSPIGMKKHFPIIAPLYLGGATLETNEIPIGDRNNSAKHTLTELWAMATA